MKLRVLAIFALVSICATAQQPVRRFSSIINHPSLNLFAPYISADGNALVFISNAGQDGALVTSYTSREADWTAPVELPKQLNSRLNFYPGYALSADGKRIYITSAKTPVIGGYDIFTAELKGTTWTNPENLMLPINSKTNDACPSFTTDGNTIYFMRCDKMDANKADECKIFKATKKSNGQWEEPVELPSNINTGNSQTPRIMGDEQTLIFSSNKMGGKGGMDLFMTRLISGSWTDPVALDFVNTDKDDQYVSVSALGRYLIKEARGQRNNWELTEYLIPAALRPKGLMKVQGKVTTPDGMPAPAYISLTDQKTNKRVYSGRPQKDGNYFFYVPEGSIYELAIEPEHSDLLFASRKFDLTTEKIPQVEKFNPLLKKPEPGDEIQLDLVQFKSYTSELEDASANELKRLARLISGNPGRKFQVQVMLLGYKEGFTQADPDLSEIRLEETRNEVISADYADSTNVMTDSANAISQRTVYHNDRTEKQAQAIIDFLIRQGIAPEQVTSFVNSIPSTDGTTSLTVKVRVLN